MLIREIQAGEEKDARRAFFTALNDVHPDLSGKHEAPDTDMDDICNSYRREDGHVFLVGVVDDQVIVTGGLTRLDDRRVKLRRMSVLPDFQGHGFGGQMLDRLEEIARERGYTEIHLDTANVLTSAIAMYTRAGYTETHREGDLDGIHLIYFRKDV